MSWGILCRVFFFCRWIENTQKKITSVTFFCRRRRRRFTLFPPFDVVICGWCIIYIYTKNMSSCKSVTSILDYNIFCSFRSLFPFAQSPTSSMSRHSLRVSARRHLLLSYEVVGRLSWLILLFSFPSYDGLIQQVFNITQRPKRSNKAK